jgi:hypothetical protein
MPGRTISAHADEQTVERVKLVARAEDRAPSQIAAAALRFYTKLPPEAHTAIRTIEAFGTEDEAFAMAGAVTRALVAAEFEIAQRRIAAQMRLENEEALHSEEAILAEAVRLTRRP